MRATISVFDPLVRGFYLKRSKEDKEKTWFDFYYEKIPHFFRLWALGAQWGPL